MANVRKRSRLDLELPATIRQSVERLLVEGETYDAIKEWLKDKGYDLSRSSIGRYGQGYLERVQNLRMLEDQARTLIGENPEMFVLEEAVSKVMTAAVLQEINTENFKIDGKSGILSDFANLQKASIMRERWKAELGRKVEKTAGEVEKDVKAKGLSESAAALIRKKILGISK
ncbi:MAG: DUF3486 family protein [Nitrospirae bacterium]|nr:DUF3486 family protein [Nitrospirota bacterium]